MATPPEPDRVQAALLAIRAANGGILTAAAIVEAAADPLHVLHDRFEWDNEKAAYRHRITQARQLVRVVRLQYIDVHGHPENIRVFHSVPSAASPTGRAYVTTDELQDNEELSSQLRRQMEIDWRAMKRRWERYGDFIKMVRRDAARMGGGEEAAASEPLALGDEG